MSSLFEILFGLGALGVLGVGAILKGVATLVCGLFHAAVFIGSLVVDAIHRHTENIDGLSVEVNDAFCNIAKSMNEAHDKIVIESAEMEKYVQTKAAQMAGEIDAHGALTLDNITKANDRVVSTINAELNDHIKREIEQTNEIQRVMAEQTVALTQQQNSIFAQLKELSNDRVMQQSTAIRYADQLLKDADTLFKNFQNDPSFPFANQVEITVIGNSIQNSKTTIANQGQNFQIMQATIISLVNAINSILSLMVRSDGEMRKSAYFAAAYQSYLETARGYLLNAREYVIKQDREERHYRLDSYAPSDFLNLYKKIDRMKEDSHNKTVFSQADVIEAKGIVTEALDVIKKAAQLLSLYETQCKDARKSILKTMRNNGIVKTDERVSILEQEGGKKIELRMKDCDNDLKPEFLIVIKPELVNGVYHMSVETELFIKSDDPILREKLSSKYSHYISKALGVSQLSCSGDVNKGHWETIENWDEDSNNIINQNKNIRKSNDAIHNKQLKKYQQNTGRRPQ